MQKLLNLCLKYAVDHFLTYNAKKSFSLCFIPRTVKISRPQLYLDTFIIPHVSECKYIGIIVYQNNCDLDLKRQMKRFYANANMLLKRFSKCSIPIKCYLFNPIRSGGGALKAPPPPPPIFCSHVFNFGAALLCVGDFFQKIV